MDDQDRDVLYRVGVAAHPETSAVLDELGREVVAAQERIQHSMAAVAENAIQQIRRLRAEATAPTGFVPAPVAMPAGRSVEVSPSVMTAVAPTATEARQQIGGQLFGHGSADAMMDASRRAIDEVRESVRSMREVEVSLLAAVKELQAGVTALRSRANSGSTQQHAGSSITETSRNQPDVGGRTEVTEERDKVRLAQQMARGREKAAQDRLENDRRIAIEQSRILERRNAEERRREVESAQQATKEEWGRRLGRTEDPEWQRLSFREAEKEHERYYAGLGEKIGRERERRAQDIAPPAPTGPEVIEQQRAQYRSTQQQHAGFTSEEVREAEQAEEQDQKRAIARRLGIEEARALTMTMKELQAEEKVMLSAWMRAKDTRAKEVERESREAQRAEDQQSKRQRRERDRDDVLYGAQVQKASRQREADLAARQSRAQQTLIQRRQQAQSIRSVQRSQATERQLKSFRRMERVYGQRSKAMFRGAFRGGVQVARGLGLASLSGKEGGDAQKLLQDLMKLQSAVDVLMGGQRVFEAIGKGVEFWSMSRQYGKLARGEAGESVKRGLSGQAAGMLGGMAGSFGSLDSEELLDLVSTKSQHVASKIGRRKGARLDILDLAGAIDLENDLFRRTTRGLGSRGQRRRLRGLRLGTRARWAMRGLGRRVPMLGGIGSHLTTYTGAAGASLGSVAGAGAAAAAGVGAALISVVDMFRQIGRHGFMGGAEKGSWTDTIATKEVEVLAWFERMANRLGVSISSVAKAMNEGAEMTERLTERLKERREEEARDVQLVGIEAGERRQMAGAEDRAQAMRRQWEEILRPTPDYGAELQQFDWEARQRDAARRRRIRFREPEPAEPSRKPSPTAVAGGQSFDELFDAMSDESLGIKKPGAAPKGSSFDELFAKMSDAELGIGRPSGQQAGMMSVEDRRRRGAGISDRELRDALGAARPAAAFQPGTLLDPNGERALADLSGLSMEELRRVRRLAGTPSARAAMEARFGGRIQTAEELYPDEPTAPVETPTTALRLHVDAIRGPQGTGEGIRGDAATMVAGLEGAGGLAGREAARASEEARLAGGPVVTRYALTPEEEAAERERAMNERFERAVQRKEERARSTVLPQPKTAAPSGTARPRDEMAAAPVEVEAPKAEARPLVHYMTEAEADRLAFEDRMKQLDLQERQRQERFAPQRERAQTNLEDAQKRFDEAKKRVDAIGDNAPGLKENIRTTEELAVSDAKVAELDRLIALKKGESKVPLSDPGMPLSRGSGGSPDPRTLEELEEARRQELAPAPPTDLRPAWEKERDEAIKDQAEAEKQLHDAALERVKVEKMDREEARAFFKEKIATAEKAVEQAQKETDAAKERILAERERIGGMHYSQRAQLSVLMERFNEAADKGLSDDEKQRFEELRKKKTEGGIESLTDEELAEIQQLRKKREQSAAENMAEHERKALGGLTNDASVQEAVRLGNRAAGEGFGRLGIGESEAETAEAQRRNEERFKAERERTVAERDADERRRATTETEAVGQALGQDTEQQLKVLLENPKFQVTLDADIDNTAKQVANQVMVLIMDYENNLKTLVAQEVKKQKTDLANQNNQGAGGRQTAQGSNS